MKRDKKQLTKVYQSPKVYELGTFKKSTLGNQLKDTADLKNYYN